jgi:PEP-CTERM motif
MKFIGYVTLLLGCGMSPLAISAPITFDFLGIGALSATEHSFQSTDGSYSVTATATSDNERTRVYSPAFYGGSPGLGVHSCNWVDAYCYDGAPTVAGGANEVLTFNFDETIRLISATFSVHKQHAETNAFSLVVDGATTVDNNLIGEGETLSEFYQTISPIVNFGDTSVGSEFSFLTDPSNSSAGYFVQSLTVEYTSEVPEPATLALFGLGLAALGSLKRKAR